MKLAILLILGFWAALLAEARADSQDERLFNPSVQADFFHCIEAGDVACVQAYCQIHPKIAASRMDQTSATHTALKARRTSFDEKAKLNSLVVLRTLLEYGAPIVEADFLYAMGSTTIRLPIQTWQGVDSKALQLLRARVEFLKRLRSQYLQHKEENTDSVFFVHWPNGAQALPPKKLIVYEDYRVDSRFVDADNSFSGLRWLQKWQQDGSVELKQLAHQSKSPVGQPVAPFLDWKLWLSEEWPAIIEPQTLYDMTQAVRRGHFSRVVDIVMYHPYVVQATVAQDINLVVPSSFDVSLLKNPRESFLGEALRRGHDEIARFLIEFQAELLPLENQPDRLEHKALQRVKQQEGLIDLYWQAEEMAPGIADMYSYSMLGKLPAEEVDLKERPDADTWNRRRFYQYNLYQGHRQEVIQKFNLHTHPCFELLRKKIPLAHIL